MYQKNVHIFRFTVVSTNIERFVQYFIIILFESGNMAHTQTHKDIQIQTDRISKKCIIKHSKGHKNVCSMLKKFC